MPDVNLNTEVDLFQAQKFASVLWGNGVGVGDVVVCLLRQRAGKERLQFGGDFDAETVGDGLQELVSDGWDAYVTPCRFDFNRPYDAETGRDIRRREDVIWTPGVWADIDVKPDTPNCIQNLDELARVLEHFPEPTINVDTGSGGRHLYWLYDEALTDNARAERLTTTWILHLSRIATTILGREIRFDSVGDLARILKLPGTWRHPKAPIWTSMPVTLLTADGPRYYVDSIEQAIPADILDRFDDVGAAVVATGLTVPADDPRVQTYVKRVVEREAAELAAWPSGAPPGRNSKLNKAAFSLGTLGAHGLLDEAEVRETLIAACVTNGLVGDDGRRTCESSFESGWYSGIKNPRDLPDFSIPTFVPGKDLASGEDAYWPTPNDSVASATRMVEQWSAGSNHPWVRRYLGAWYNYKQDSGNWDEIDREGTRASIRLTLNGKTYVDKEGDEAKIYPTTGMVRNHEESLEAILRVPNDTRMPTWLDGAASEPDRPAAHNLIVLKNGMLDRTTGQLMGHDERLFTTNALPFEYDDDAACPDWLSFLRTSLPEDAIDTLQEVFGYIVSGRKDLQKIFLLWGLPRSGKGTIARVLQYLVGDRSHVATTLGQLGSDFGCQPLIGKSLAVVGDARLTGKTSSTVERLLSISGDDVQTINRKNKDHWTGRLGVRFLILSNELPNLSDTSGAIASRFIILRTSESFLGSEDHTLEDRLNQELPGIFNWALEGEKRLQAKGKFSEPKSMADDQEDLHDAASPMSVFVKNHCALGPELWSFSEDLYEAWAVFSEVNGNHAGFQNRFGRAIRSVVQLKKGKKTKNGDQKNGYYGIEIVKPPESLNVLPAWKPGQV